MFAAIDIGTNTVLLLIAEYDGNTLEVIHEEQRIPRLGKGVDEHRNLDEASVDQVIRALKDYRRIIDRYFSTVSDTIVIATSAVRDASNKGEFKARVKQETGFEVRILSGEEEARWTYSGARCLVESEVAEIALSLDIGGGSSEISLGRGDQLIDYHSFDIGSVRFTERFIHSDPPRKDEIANCRQAIAAALEEHIFTWQGAADTIGVAGTVTSLAFMEANLAAYEPDKLAGMRMERKRVENWREKISEMASVELRDAYPVVMEGRADVFLTGILILEEFLKRYDFGDFIVSTGGIRHGAILNVFGN